MGASFTNLALRGPHQNEVLEYLSEAGKRAFVGPTFASWTLLTEASSESFDFDVVRLLAEDLTRHFACPAISVQFYDDDVLLAQIYASGEFVESYSSNPAYGAEDILEMLEFARGGDAEKIAVTFEMPEAAPGLQKALHEEPDEPDEEYASLNERLSEAIESGNVEEMRKVQLRLMEKTRELAESGEDPFLKYAPGFEARRRYAGLVQALGLPAFCQDFGFTYLEAGENPAGLIPGTARRTEPRP